MTIRELFREFVAAKRRARREHDRDIAHAWHVASYAGAMFVGKLPDLKKVLSTSEREPQGMKQHRAALEILSAQYGYPLRQREARVAHGQ